ARGAMLAQPSGLACEGDRLLFVDAETSALREIDLAQLELTTLAGRGLFSYGDLDGPRESALLQHPLAVASHSGDVLIADAYNAKVKRLSRASGRIDT